MMREACLSVRHAGTGAASLLLLSGCMTATLEEDRTLTTAIADHEARGDHPRSPVVRSEEISTGALLGVGSSQPRAIQL